MTCADATSVIDWAWAGHALEGESGDLHVVASFDGGVMVALIDGLGHGPEAAEAAAAACRVLEVHASDPVLDLIRRCHDALRKTRGAAMTVASLSVSESEMTWVGVGNVDAILLRGIGHRDVAIANRGGVVGYQLPPLREATVAIAHGDLLVMATDGVYSGFTSAVEIDDPPDEIARSILARYARGSDDAHIVVARFLGGAS